MSIICIELVVWCNTGVILLVSWPVFHAGCMLTSTRDILMTCSSFARSAAVTCHMSQKVGQEDRARDLSYYKRLHITNQLKRVALNVYLIGVPCGSICIETQFLRDGLSLFVCGSRSRHALFLVVRRITP